MKAHSRIRYPNRRQRRAALRTSSLHRWMSWGIFHPSKMKAIRDNVFAPNPLIKFAKGNDA
jgi:hypothetical protein